MRIPMFDHQAHFRRDQKEIEAAVLEVLESGKLIMGPAVRAFEEEFAAYSQARYAVGVASGTSAIHLALRALGIGPGDEVITVANSDIPTSQAVTLTGAKVVWVDIDKESYNMDPDALPAALSPATKALLPVHLYGVPAEMSPILQFAEANGLSVVEDAALATGARYRGQRIGSLGTLTAFSTAPGKMLDGVGSGGMISTDSEILYDKLNSLRHYGRERPPYRDLPADTAKWPSKTVEIGYNERLDTLDAAVLRIRLRRLDETLTRRREIAKRYQDLLEGDVGLQRPPQDAEAVWRVFTVRIPDRDRIFEAMYRQGIGVSLAYLPPNHLDECYHHLGYRKGSLPETEAFADELLALPCHPYMTDSQVEEVAESLLALL
ncbi:MAG: DegT/DnrJ/EryC1/StrS family aminotransferase [Trueperaceae bacterium]|nr:MAG: DegT/DnrJ/EryC1/StrS family aminotransferase [Trueperaceae bacterium]